MADNTTKRKVPRGYKETKIGLIPNDWDVIRIKDCIASSRGINPAKTPDKQFKYIDISAICNGTYRIKEHQAINSVNAPSRARKEIRTGDIIYATVRPYLKRLAVISKEYDRQICSTGFCVLRPTERINGHYLFHILLTEQITQRISQLQVGTNYPAVSDSDILCQLIPLPSRTEQDEISEIISTWDSAIVKTEKLISAKQKFKKALCQRLLTGSCRFNEFKKQKWKSVTLKDFLVPQIRPIPKPSTAFMALGIRSFGKGTFQKPNFVPSDIELQELYQVKKDDLIVNITFAWEGAIAIVKESDDGALVSHRFPTYEFDRCVAIPEYFRHVLLQKRFVDELGLVSPGGAGRNRVLSKTGFLKIKVTIPPLAEQHKIGALLNSLDREINLLGQHLELLKQQKRGLMQKLLNGKIRVKGIRADARN